MKYEDSTTFQYNCYPFLIPGETYNQREIATQPKFISNLLEAIYDASPAQTVGSKYWPPIMGCDTFPLVCKVVTVYNNNMCYHMAQTKKIEQIHPA